MVDTHTHGCPEPEVLAAYVDHGLSLAERARVEGHLASCPQCTALLAGVVRTAAEIARVLPQAVETAEARPLGSWRAVAGACTAAAAVIAVLAAPFLLRPWLERDAGLVSLASSVGEQRSVLGRLTGGFPHAPLDVSSAGGQDDQAAGTDRVLLTAGRIRESVGETATPSRLHALGVSQLLARRYDDAAQLLLAASREQPANAQYLNDVAAVQLERARRGLRPDDLPRALAAADRARRLDPSLREAWFNRALAISALSLTDQAKAAWTEYLRRDGSSPWASEARKRLEELSKPTPAEAWAQIEGRLQQSIDAATADLAVRTQTTEARQFIENELFVEWANAVLAGNDGAAELDRLRVMSEAMLRVAGDALYLGAVDAINRARGSDATLQSLARPHRRYADAAALMNEDRYVAAEPAMRSAREEMQRAGSPYSLRIAMDLGAIAYFTGQWPRVETAQQELVHDARARHYPYIEGRVSWQQGLAAVAQGKFAEAQVKYEAALAAFEHMGDVEQTASANGLLAALNDYLGESGAAWRHRSKALEQMGSSRSPRVKYSLLASAVPSIRAESPETALSVQEAALAVAREWKRDAAIADSLAQRASLLASLGRDEEADRALAEAKLHAQQILDPAFKSRIEVFLLSTESDLQQRRNPAAAVAAATRAIDIVQQRGDRLRLAQLNLRLAKANILSGRYNEAKSALAQGLIAFNQERASSTEERPISALDESWELFDASIQLSLRERDYQRAFALSETARARSTTDPRYGVAPFDAVQRRLRREDAILALNQFDNELAVWIIRRDTADVLMQPITRRDSLQLIGRQQSEIWRESESVSAGRELYNLILRPATRHLADVSRIIVVPDATFENVAFGALWDSARGRFLSEQMTIRMAPAASSVTQVAGEATGGLGHRDPVVFSADDSTAREIATAYRASQVIAGSAATRERFFTDAVHRAIVHVAAPTTTNTSFPLLSRIALADTPGHRYSGMILGREIAQQQMTQTGLVVVDEIKATQSNRGEGTLSMARAFMLAGVPAVLVTLPGSDENATRDLMIAFHREVANGVSAEQALTTIQRNAIRKNGRRLGAWSALVLYGSDR